ncbi:hypothetical protein DOTSEDRAFT_24779 [Lecanosticta acicola]|uniref:Survival motor neuron Tudor domain-containing protein n=1 Tax=Lecanosticta acicola TaxID=111012 RepID=A0AAI8YTX1_9PEZI|nr:hypothetical protein DOTSEDRAFT_24779 [Lecanosticta acicola]
MAAKGEKVNLLTLKTANTSAGQPNGASKQQTTPNAPPNFAGDPAPAPPMPPAGLANMPQGLMNSSQSEQLKNIMTAWYYAGYYTGFYDGQQNAWSNMPQQG